jgi:hypothetical protein
LQSGFIPGAVVMTSHFYTSKELAVSSKSDRLIFH